jgi:hypothetical protein
MSIGETHAVECQPIQVRRGNARIRVVTTDIPVTQIIGEDQHDVGWLTGVGH